MRIITCFVGGLRRPVRPINVPFTLGGGDPAQFFTNASSAVTGQPALDLRFDFSRFTPLVTPPASSLLALHIALGDLTGNGPVVGPVHSVGLILTDIFPPRPTVLGMMFDVGFNIGISDPTFNDVPREGCAVFLDAVRALRGEGPAYEAEVAFTAVHELGHVFNLWHVSAPPNLMTQSQTGNVFGDAALFFVGRHASFLSMVDSPFVAPGGSRWGVRGTLGPPGDNPLNDTPSRRRLRLRIGTRQPEFWRFEPVELEVTLSASSAMRVPDVIDPGYEAFDIWIESPDGTRQRYRSPALYCANSGSLTISPRKPFRRDVSLWGQAGGYTFQHAGIHRLYCTLRIGRRIVRSNTIEILVRDALPRSAKYRRLAATLTRPGNARLLFYKSAPEPLAAAGALIDAARDARGTPSAANIRYNLAQALISAGRSRRGPARRRYERSASNLLKAAIDSDGLSDSRRLRASDALLDLDSIT